ncbi:hypothetical protein ANRL1_01646 [Anaerolineae bacterium]|nr:hypothetical protein ANRL1_01646 [Anaerolineae bacterium]
MPGLLQRILEGNFSSPLTLVFIVFTLLAFYFLFRLAWLFFVRGDEVAESIAGKREAKNLVRLLIISVVIALFSGFVFEFVRAGRDVAQSSAPSAAKGFFDWLVGK